MVEQRGDVRPGSIARAFDVLFDISLHRLIRSFELRRRRDPETRQAPGAALERAPLHPRLDLLAGSIGAVELMIEMRSHVLAPTIRHAFEKERPATGAQIIERRFGSVVDFV